MRGIGVSLGRVVGSGTLLAVLALSGTPLSAQSTHEQMASGDGVIEIPLHVDPAGRLIVPVQAADGRTLSFAVSTMVPSTMVASSLAGGDAAALGLRLDGLDGPLEVAAMPDAAFLVDGHRIDGFLGLATLGDFDVLVDAPNGRLVLRPIGREVAWSGVELSEPTRLNVFHGVALRLDIAVAGTPFGATLDLANPSNHANPGAAKAAGLSGTAPASVRLSGVARDLHFDIGDTPVLDRWDPDGNGFVSLGAPFVQHCALSLSYFHQEVRTCLR